MVIDRRLTYLGATTLLLLGDHFLSGGTPERNWSILFIALAASQGALYSYLNRLQEQVIRRRVLVTQALLWPALIGSLLVRNVMIERYEGFSAELPLMTQAWFDFHAILFGRGILAVPILTLLLAAPYALWSSPKQSRVVFWVEVLLAIAIVVYTPAALFAPMFCCSMVE